MNITKKEITHFLSIGLCAGFIIGFATSLYAVADNLYVQNTMLRITAMCFREGVTMWSFFGVLASVALIALLVLLNISAAGLQSVFEIKIKDHKRAKRFFAYFLAASLFAVWAGASYFLRPSGSYGGSLLAFLAVIIVIVCALWISNGARRRVYARRIYGALSARINKIALLVCLFVAGLNGALLIDANLSAQETPNFVVLLLDCVRRDSLGCYGNTSDTAPFINQLAQDGVVFANAYSSASWTKPAIASLLTSLYPNAHGLVNPRDRLSSSHVTLAEALRDKGYQTLCFNGGNQFVAQEFNFHQGYDVYQCSNSMKDAEKLTDAFLSTVAKGGDKKFFAFLHYMDAHTPYWENSYTEALTAQSSFFYDSSKAFADSVQFGGLFGNLVRNLTVRGKLLPSDKAYIKSLYESELRYIDDQIRRIVASLKSEGLFDDTIFIVLSDHGEEFWDHDGFEHGHTLYNELITIPLIISGKNISHAEITSPVSLIDLYPTILELAEISNESLALQGECLTQALYQHTEPSLDRTIFAMGTLYGDEKYCLISQNNKIIYNTGAQGAEKFSAINGPGEEGIELYGLLSDPYEKNALEQSDVNTFGALQQELFNFRDKPSYYKAEEIVVSNELRENLESLGYIQ